MSQPLSDHLSSLMGGDVPSEDELRKAYEEGLKEDLEDDTKVEDEDDTQEDEIEDDDETQVDDEEEDEEEEDDDEEPMSQEELQNALLAAQAERDEARKEADGRLKALTEQRSVANDLKTKIESLEETVKTAIPEEPEVPAPNKDEDPLGYVAWQQENVVAPLVKTVEDLQTGLKQMQMHSMLTEVETGINQHVAAKIGSNKTKQKQFEDARNFMVNAYQEHFMKEEGATEQSVGMKIRVIAANAGAQVMQQGGDFADYVIEEAKKVGWKAATEDPVRKVKRGQKTNKMGSTGGSRRNRVKGKKVTKAMMEAPDGEPLSHDEKIRIIGNDDHRRNLMTQGFTYIQE